MILEVILPDKKLNVVVENYRFENIVPIIRHFEKEYQESFEIEFKPPKLVFRRIE